MKRPHRSTDLREQALAAVDAGRPTVEIVVWFGVHARTIRRGKQARRERGSVASRPRSGRRPTISAEQHPALRAQLAAHPDATLAEHAQKKSLIDREQDAAERAAFRAELATEDPATLIFVDETAASLRLTPLRGRSPRGERLIERVPRGR